LVDLRSSNPSARTGYDAIWSACCRHQPNVEVIALDGRRPSVYQHHLHQPNAPSIRSDRHQAGSPTRGIRPDDAAAATAWLETLPTLFAIVRHGRVADTLATWRYNSPFNSVSTCRPEATGPAWQNWPASR
jgi:hypothetical protein